jgi:hypothetical protein
LSPRLSEVEGWVGAVLTECHRVFAQVAEWEHGRVRQAGLIALTAEAPRVFCESLGPVDEFVIEATCTPTRSSG